MAGVDNAAKKARGRREDGPSGRVVEWLRALGTRHRPDLQSIALARRVTLIITILFGFPALMCQWLYVTFYRNDNLFLLYLPLPMGLLLLAGLVRAARQPTSRLTEQLLPMGTLVYTLACLVYRAAYPERFPPDIDLIMILLVVLTGTSVCLRLTPVRAGIGLAALLFLHSLPLLIALAHHMLSGPALLRGVMTELSLTSLLALMYSSVWTQLALGRSEATSRELTYLSQTDHLTGLYNRRSLYGSIEALMAEYLQATEAPQATGEPAHPVTPPGGRPGGPPETQLRPPAVNLPVARPDNWPAGHGAGAQPPAQTEPTERPPTFALVLLDIDHFKSVNDTFGHASGDTVLCGVAGVLESFVRQRDLAGRWGGEEFLMVLPGVPLGRAAVIAERLRQQLADAHILPGRAITASFGVTVWTPGETPEALIARADAAMYRAKNGGRNRVEVGPA